MTDYTIEHAKNQDVVKELRTLNENVRKTREFLEDQTRKKLKKDREYGGAWVR